MTTRRPRLIKVDEQFPSIVDWEKHANERFSIGADLVQDDVLLYVNRTGVPPYTQYLFQIAQCPRSSGELVINIDRTRRHGLYYFLELLLEAKRHYVEFKVYLDPTHADSIALCGEPREEFYLFALLNKVNVGVITTVWFAPDNRYATTDWSPIVLSDAPLQPRTDAEWRNAKFREAYKKFSRARMTALVMWRSEDLFTTACPDAAYHELLRTSDGEVTITVNIKGRRTEFKIGKGQSLVQIEFEVAYFDKMKKELERAKRPVCIAYSDVEHYFNNPYYEYMFYHTTMTDTEWRWYSQHAVILDVCIALAALSLPPYVLLEIVDWLPKIAYRRRVTKITLIEGVHFSIRRIRERK